MVLLLLLGTTGIWEFSLKKEEVRRMGKTEKNGTVKHHSIDVHFNMPERRRLKARLFEQKMKSCFLDLAKTMN